MENIAAIELRIDVATGNVSVTPPPGPALGEGAPSFSLLGSDVIRMETRNGACAPSPAGKRYVRCTFELAVLNRLERNPSTFLVTPASLPKPPAGVRGILVFPFAATAIPSGTATPTSDWDHAPISMFSGAACGRSTSDCFRYELYPGGLGGEELSEYRMVGFDVDRNATGVIVQVAVGADFGEVQAVAIGDMESCLGVTHMLATEEIPEYYDVENWDVNFFVGSRPAGDFRGFCQFDLASIPETARLVESHLSFRNMTVRGDPFEGFGGVFPQTLQAQAVWWDPENLPQASDLYHAEGDVSLDLFRYGISLESGENRSVIGSVEAAILRGDDVAQYQIRWLYDPVRTTESNGILIPTEPVIYPRLFVFYVDR